MNRHLCFVTAACFAVCGFCAPRATAQDYDLEIITPHNEQIQREFERGFVQSIGRPLKIRWILKGTGEIMQQLEAQDRATKGGSFGLDVFFGGGVPDHDLAAQKGFTEAITLPADILKAIPAQIAGVANYDPQHRWHGAAHSSFGILVNTKGLAAQGLPSVASWEDLAAPKMYSWVVLADPRKSASVRVAYELVLQQHGWEKGWPLLLSMGANARTITPSSSAIPNEIATANVLAGPCVDFYAYARISQAPDVLAYVAPASGTAITPDPISLLRKPPHRELSDKFIAFVLSAAGQRLWVLPPGTPGGPAEHALYRLSVRPDVCAEAAGKSSVKDPYKEAEAGVYRKVDDNLQRSRSAILAELMGAAIVDQHADCRAAWKALIDGSMKPAALAEWNKLPFSQEESLKLAEQIETGGRDAKKLTRDWTNWFHEKYEAVKKLSK